jgi:hypothetical protein
MLLKVQMSEEAVTNQIARRTGAGKIGTQFEQDTSTPLGRCQ